MHGIANHPRIVGIAGGSCAGKSWLADRLAQSLGNNAARLSLDDFYLDRSHLPPARRARLNFDHPRAIDWPRVEQVLRRCASGLPASVPRYDFATHARRAGEWALHPAQVVIVEGLWLYRRAAIRDLLSFKIFIRAPEELCAARRLERDTRERGRGADQVLNQWNQHALPMFHRFVAPQEKWADMILQAPISAEEVSPILNRIAENLCPYGI